MLSGLHLISLSTDCWADLADEPSIAIVMTYLAQVRHIESLIKTLIATACDATLRGRLRAVEVAAVEFFQGRQADIVNNSTVRTEREGFTGEDNRVTAAVSRPSHALWVLGTANIQVADWFQRAQSPPHELDYDLPADLITSIMLRAKQPQRYRHEYADLYLHHGGRLHSRLLAFKSASTDSDSDSASDSLISL